ncbi:hypothetical protein Dimus_025925 [Dionaea muscipula]
MNLKIQKVPQILKDITGEGNKSCYEPMVVSLGPYHYGKAKYKHMEELKKPMMQQFIEGSGKEESEVREIFRKAVVSAEVEYYDVDIKDDKNIDILFRDSCFLIQFIRSYMKKDRMQVKMKLYETAFVIRDIFLLENQLPFPLVKSLMMLREESSLMMLREEESLMMLREESSLMMLREEESLMMLREEDKILPMIQGFIDTIRSSPVPRQPKLSFLKRTWNLLRGTSKNAPSPPRGWELLDDPLHLLHALQKKLIDDKLGLVEKINQSEDDEDTLLYSYRNVTELLAAGVSFRSGKPWERFTDIRFKDNLMSPVLTIPPIIIDDSTPALFLNLVAFEALPGAPDDLGVTSFLWFMDSLIDTADDVKELRSKGIVVNYLGSDQQVADMFNSISYKLVPNVGAYGRVKAGIEGHFRSKNRVLLAQWLHEHFTTPWSAIGLFGAFVAVVLSFVQAYYAAFPRGSSGA